MRCNKTPDRSSSPPPRALIDALEPRRMLTVFNGTDGPDTIVLRRGTDGVTHVSINGGAVQDTSDQAVIINALGGNDSVYFPELRHFNAQERFLQLFLGDGDDLASKLRPSDTNRLVGRSRLPPRGI